METLIQTLEQLICKTSSTLPEDISRVIKVQRDKEEEGSNARYALDVILENVKQAAENKAPLCQDTGTNIYTIFCPQDFPQMDFIKAAEQATVNATKNGHLRQNAVHSITGKNSGNNLGKEAPVIHFHVWDKPHAEIRLMLKGGGCENVGIQYSLPDVALNAGRDLKGVKNVILDAVVKAQGKGCGPGILGVAIGGDRGTGYVKSKEQFLRTLDDINPDPELATLEKEIVTMANELGIGPMGFGGNTTLLGCKIDHFHRVPASYFVTISYMCWAFRRQGISLNPDFTINQWLY
jgi:fumarate hydratase class I